MGCTMLGTLKTLISRLADVASSSGPCESRKCRLATAALLMRVATVDGEMSEARRRKLHAVLQLRFALDDAATARLIEEAAAADRGAVDLYHFTRQLNGALDDEGRRQIVRMMWEVILADGRPTDAESNIVWRAADLLAVPARQRIELRQRIAAGPVAPAAACRRAAESG